MNRTDTSRLRASQMTQANLPRTAAARYRDREAIYCPLTGRRFSFREVNERMNRLANALIGLGVGKGEHCAFLCRNRAEAGEIYGALVKIGAVAVPLQWGFGPDEVVDYLGYTEASRFFFEDIYAETAARVRKDLGGIETFIAIGARTPGFGLSYDELIGDASPLLPFIEVDSDDVQCIDTTSRTTGVRKVYPLTHANGLNALTFLTTLHDLTPKDVILTLFPIYGRAGLAWYGAGFLTGARNVLFHPDLADPYGILRIIQQERVTITNWTPVVASLLLSLPDLDRYDLSSLRGISFAASPFPVALQQQVREKLCPNIYEYYALQEAGIISHMGPADKLNKPASVGTRSFGMELRVVDEAGHDVPPGGIGQIICKGLTVAPGYFKDEGETRAAFRDGWFYTGDWGRLDEDEFLYFLGRRQDMIVTGGRTVFAGAVEEVLLAHEGVATTRPARS
jgi:fatty-acyl-CoA synthase